jgi:hypothetical protein
MPEALRQPISIAPFPSVPSTSRATAREPHARRAYRALQLGFVVAPVVAGTDKFFDRLTNWDQYLAPVVPRTLGIDGRTFMKGVGAIEVVAGVGVAVKPRVFAYVVSGWLVGIVGNLLLTRRYYDIALRDVGLALGAFALGNLAQDRPGLRSIPSRETA